MQKILVSSTGRFVGQYTSSWMAIDHAWLGLGHRSGQSRLTQGPTSRSAYVVSFRTDPEKDDKVIVNSYGHVGEVICACMAVLYGKRFDNHGAFEASGYFNLPDLAAYNTLCDEVLPQNTHTPRVDLEIPLNLEEVARLTPLLESELTRGVIAFRGAARFYLQALQAAEHDLDVAYLHLITAGEVISGALDFKEEALLSADVRRLLADIEAHLPDGQAAANTLRSQLRGIKRAFVAAFDSLVDDAFFDRSECSQAYGALKRADFLRRMGSAYDLRSLYVHTGRSFGGWVSRRGIGNEEIQIGIPVIDGDRDFARAIHRAPTYIGLERIVRYALLRLAERCGVDLSGQQPTVTL